MTNQNIGLDYAECLQEAMKLIEEASTETRTNAVKAALLEINKLNKEISNINVLLDQAEQKNWKPLLTKYANDLYEIHS